MIPLLITSFLWFGLTTGKLQKQIEQTQLKLAAMCISRTLGETTCYDAMNEITNLRFKFAISKRDIRKEVQHELELLIEKYGIQ